MNANQNPIKILSIGNISVDIKAYTPEEDGTEAYRDGNIELVPGGVGRGMAINLKRLGLDSYLLAYVGKDIFGDYLSRELEENKVNTSLLRRSSEYKTSLFSVMSSASSKTASCIYNTNIVREITLDNEVRNVIERENIKNICMDSNLTHETLSDFYELKKENPDFFIFQNATAPDLARKTLEWAPLIDLFACNEYEAEVIIGESPEADLPTADKMQALGFKNFIITLGSRGVMVRIGNQTYIQPPYKLPKIVDTIGAGDAFASGFLMGYLEKANIKQCINYGLACAKETLLTKQTTSEILSRAYLETYQFEENSGVI